MALFHKSTMVDVPAVPIFRADADATTSVTRLRLAVWRVKWRRPAVCSMKFCHVINTKTHHRKWEVMRSWGVKFIPITNWTYRSKTVKQGILYICIYYICIPSIQRVLTSDWVEKLSMTWIICKSQNWSVGPKKWQFLQYLNYDKYKYNFHVARSFRATIYTQHHTERSFRLFWVVKNRYIDKIGQRYSNFLIFLLQRNG